MAPSSSPSESLSPSSPCLSVPSPSLLDFLPFFLPLVLSLSLFQSACHSLLISLRPFDSFSSRLSFCLAATRLHFCLSEPLPSLSPHLPLSLLFSSSYPQPLSLLTFRKSRVKPRIRLWRPRKPEELSRASASRIGAAAEGGTRAEGTSSSRTRGCHIAGRAGRLWQR